MATILSDEILSNLNCSICKQYLSFGPTKIHSNKVISCGRCNTNETTSPNSLYEKVARFTFFPCINRYDGCNKLLQYKDVPQHEKLCKGTKIICPICPSEHANEISLLCLIDHYKNFHKEYFLCESKFVIDSNKNLDCTYLYCDNLNNCLFFITIRSTQDRLFLNASVSGQKKVVQRFRLNNSLLEPNTIRLCTLFPETDHQFEVKIQEEPMEIYNHISCEFLYEVMEKTLPMIIATDLNFDEPEKREKTFRKLPKLFIDADVFPGKHKFKLSPCKTRLIDEYDDKFSLKLKCDFCQTYFWNILEWRPICVGVEKIFRPNYWNDKEIVEYGLYSSRTCANMICLSCKRYLRYDYVENFKGTASSIFKMQFYCRHNCGTVCKIVELIIHEKQCNFNLKKNLENFIKKIFAEVSYNSEDIFINGNIVHSINLPLVKCDQELPETNNFFSSERVIYVINDDGFKLKIFYKFMNGTICVRIEHDLDKNKYFIGLRTCDYPWKEVVFEDWSYYRPVELLAASSSETIVKLKSFIVINKKKNLGSIVTL